MGHMHGHEMEFLHEEKRQRRHDRSICELLSELPPSTTLTEILVDGVPFAVASFINLNTETNLAYFTSVIGTTLIVDCDRISQIIF